jgi:hypothetical protein
MQTKADLIARNHGLVIENTNWLCATNDLINGKVRWFVRGKIALGICRPTGASGGIVIRRMTQPDGEYYSTVYNWDDYSHSVLEHLPSHTDRDAQNEFNAASEAQSWVRKEQSKM